MHRQRQRQLASLDWHLGLLRLGGQCIHFSGEAFSILCQSVAGAGVHEDLDGKVRSVMLDCVVNSRPASCDMVYMTCHCRPIAPYNVPQWLLIPGLVLAGCCSAQYGFGCSSWLGAPSVLPWWAQAFTNNRGTALSPSPTLPAMPDLQSVSLPQSLYAQAPHVTVGGTSVALPLLLGGSIWILGQLSNAYCHWQLASLRSDGTKAYKVSHRRSYGPANRAHAAPCLAARFCCVCCWSGWIVLDCISIVVP